MTPKSLARLESFEIAPKSRPFDLTVFEGTSLAVLGPSGCGKSRLIEALGQACKSVTRPLETFPARATPQSLVRHLGADAATEALSLLGLWDVRRETISNLTSGKRRMSALLPVVAAQSGLVLVDGELDLVDLWLQEQLMNHLVNRPKTGLVIVTLRPDVAEYCSEIAVVNNKGLRATGTVEDLRRDMAPFEARIHSQNSQAVRHVTRGLGLQLLQDNDALHVKLDRGLDEAVKLCLKGYAAVDAVTVRIPSLKEVIRHRGR